MELEVFPFSNSYFVAKIDMYLRVFRHIRVFKSASQCVWACAGDILSEWMKYVWDCRLGAWQVKVMFWVYIGWDVCLCECVKGVCQPKDRGWSASVSLLCVPTSWSWVYLHELRHVDVLTWLCVCVCVRTLSQQVPTSHVKEHVSKSDHQAVESWKNLHEYFVQY